MFVSGNNTFHFSQIIARLEPTQWLPSRVGSYPKTLDQAEKACQVQKLELIYHIPRQNKLACFTLSLSLVNLSSLV